MKAIIFCFMEEERIGWVFNQASGEFDYKKHYYSDTAFYFITSGPGNGKRVTAAISS